MRKKVLTLDAVIAGEIEYAIENNEYAEGDRLPAERKLAEEFGVQRGTIRNALGILGDRGVIIAKERSGHLLRLAELILISTHTIRGKR